MKHILVFALLALSACKKEPEHPKLGWIDACIKRHMDEHLAPTPKKARAMCLVYVIGSDESP